jgi:DNA-binding transcriptional LysR family regulator
LIITTNANILFALMNNLGTLGDFAVFTAVAETEGFSAAAKRLGVSKAMVSTAVSRLELHLGVRLFQRTTRRLSLTEAGAATLAHAQRALLAVQDAEEAATSGLISPRGVLRVSAPMSFGLLHVVPALGEFTKTHPEVRVDLVLDDRVLDLVEGGFDLALRIGTLSDSALIAHPLGKSRNTIVAHPDYLARAGMPKKPKDLEKHAALLFTLHRTGSNWTLKRGKVTEVVRVSGPLKANSSLALRDALLQGMGLAHVPYFVVGADVARGALVPVLSEWKLVEHGIFALTVEREFLPRKTRAFIDFLRERIGDPPYWEERSTRA